MSASCDLALQDAALHGAAGKVMASLRNHWHGLTVFVAHPEIPLDNNLTYAAAKYLSEQQPMAIRHAAWYAKDKATVSNTIALVRRSIWGAQIYDGARNRHEMVKIPRALPDRLTETVSYAV